MILQDPNFCRTYLFLPSNILNLPIIFVILSGLTTFTLVLSFNYEDEDVQKGSNIAETMHKVVNLVKKQPFKMIMVYLLTCSIGISFFKQVLPLMLFDKGMKKENSMLIDFITFPFNIYACTLIPKDKHRNLAKYNDGIKLSVITNIFSFLIFTYFDLLRDNMTLLYGVKIVTGITSKIISVYLSNCIFTFICKVADPSIGGTTVTLLSGLMNLSDIWPSYYLFMLADSVDPFYLFAFSITYSLVFMQVASPFCDKLDSLASKEWHINSKENNKYE